MEELKNTFSPGVYPIFKPIGITSFHIIYQLRKITGIKKIGHAGTLDPLASGVLVVAIGRNFTKHLDQLMINDKEYVGEITFGKSSTTDDAEGEKTEFEIKEIPSFEQVKVVITHWIGAIEQKPPLYSAIKIRGQSAHRRARKGQVIELQPRTVEIMSIEVLGYEWPTLKIKVHCGKGVYIRSLARDIGKELGVGGYLSSLERIRVGEFLVKDAINIA